MLLNLLGERLAAHHAWTEHDKSLDHLAALGVRAANSCAFLHCRVLAHSVLHLGRADAVAAGVDQVVGAPEVEDVAVGYLS